MSVRVPRLRLPELRSKGPTLGMSGSGHAVVGAALIVALLPGCWVPLERGRLMEARIEKLEASASEQEKQLEEQRALVKDRVAKADAKIAEVQEKLDELNKAARRSGADLGVQLQKVQDDLAKLGGELEVEQHKLAELEKSIAAVKADTEGRLAALKGAGALDQYEARQKLQALPKPDDKTGLLELAKKEETSGDKGVARELYEEFVRRFPDDPRAAEAGVKAGDLLAGQRRWREALLAYGKVAQDFPKAAEAPVALVGAADAMLKLDMKDDAKALLQQVVDRYPKSGSAARAKARLAELRKPAAAPKKTK
ncbi:MAG: tetratricopeptide repeat protein [Anaeromyxobacter sp.]